MQNSRVLDVGNCDPDHGAIRAMLTENFDVAIDRVMFVSEALAAMQQTAYSLVLVNRLIFADESPGAALLDALQKNAAPHPPVMLVSNFPEAHADAVSRGGVSGFGKASLRSAETLRRLAQFLPPRENAGRGTAGNAGPVSGVTARK